MDGWLEEAMSSRGRPGEVSTYEVDYDGDTDRLTHSCRM